MSEKQKILVLGGSTFMGLRLLQILSQEQYDVYYINRGKKYWNNSVKKIPNTNHIFGNRNEKKEYSKLIKYISEKIGISPSSNKKWAAVYDFCAFKYSEVQAAYDALKGIVDLYVFISTDSIYDVCEQKVRQGCTFIKESHAVRPTLLTQIRKLKEQESYGHHKLKCEEFLYHFTQKDLFPFVILRLPDVIGPYDDTGRFWAYLKWIQKSQDYPIIIDDEAQNQRLSLVFSEDVANLCLQFIKTNKSDFIYNSYNIAFRENPTLYELLQKMQQIGNLPKINFEKKDGAQKIYPSVDCGPIDIQKATEKLDWNPTNLDDALKTTINFFKNADQYRQEEKQAEKKLQKKLK